MEQYLDYVDGKHIGKAEPMPLYFKPKQQLSLQDVMNSMRDHYEGTPFDITKDAGAGPYDAPYRPTPLSWEYQGKNILTSVRSLHNKQQAHTSSKFAHLCPMLWAVCYGSETMTPIWLPTHPFTAV